MDLKIRLCRSSHGSAGNFGGCGRVTGSPGLCRAVQQKWLVEVDLLGVFSGTVPWQASGADCVLVKAAGAADAPMTSSAAASMSDINL